MTPHCITADDVKSAMTRIRDYVHRTPLMTCSFFDNASGRKIFFKTENLQKTGSCKFRGDTNVILQLQNLQNKPKCVVTESGGNHGQALAKAASMFGVPCHVVMPDWSLTSKVETVRSFGANVYLISGSPRDRQNMNEELMDKHNGIFISANQNPNVIAGQGTIAIEILEQNPDVNVIVAAVGGGGLISGIAVAAKAIKPSIKIVAAEPAKADDCYQSMLKGELVKIPDDPETIADALRIGIGENTWPIIHDLVDEVITVSESEIKAAMLLVWKRAKLVIEPSTGVSVAAVMSEKFRLVKGQNVAVVLCGGNVDFEKLSEML